MAGLSRGSRSIWAMEYAIISSAPDLESICHSSDCGPVTVSLNLVCRGGADASTPTGNKFCSLATLWATESNGCGSEY